MSKKPIYNSISAILYISSIVYILSYITEIESIETSLLMPIMMLSLFTLSVAVMGYIFFYNPIVMYIEGKKEEAISLFLKSILYFSLFPISIFLLYFFGILK